MSFIELPEGYSLADITSDRRHRLTGQNEIIPQNSNISQFEDDTTVLDSEWMINRFMASDSELTDVDRVNRYWTSAKWKTFDSSIGNNIFINPKPQFTRYCDIRGGARNITTQVTTESKSGKFGMGRYYSEAIDDNATVIFMEFGHAKFNSIVNYFIKAVDGLTLRAAKTGRVPNEYVYEAGKLIGQGFMMLAFPICSTLAWAIKTGVDLLNNGGQTFSYYYLKQSMHTYWGSVTTIVNQWANEKTLLSSILEKGTAKQIGMPYKIDEDDWKSLSETFPDIFKASKKYIDVYGIATRGQAIASRWRRMEYLMYKNSIKHRENYEGYVKKANSTSEYKSPGSTMGNTLDNIFSVDAWLNGNNDKIKKFLADAANRADFDNYLTMIKNQGGMTYDDKNKDPNNPPDKSSIKLPDDYADKGFSSESDSLGYSGDYVSEGEIKEQESFANMWKAFIEDDDPTLDAVWRDGGMFAVFAVDYQGSVSESFSNNTGEIAIKEGIKSVAKGVHDFRFNMAGGNIQDDINEAVKTIGDFVKGAVEGVTLGFSNVVSTLLGAYIDMPLKWDDSSSSLPSITYKMKLISPYGNPISQLQNIYIPLAMLLAGTLPQSVGKYAYTSPFLCSLFNKGVQKINLGMITSLSITRGTSNLPFSRSKAPLAIDVSFTVTDFSTLIATPINKGMVTNNFSLVLEDDTNMGKYIQTLASRDVLTNKYLGPKFRLLGNRIRANTAQWLSSAQWAFRAGEMLNQSPAGMFVNDMTIGYSQGNNFNR